MQSIASQPAGTAGATAGAGSGGGSAFSGGSGFGGAYGGSIGAPSGVGGYGASVPNVGDTASGTSGSVPNLFSRFGDQGAFASGSVGPDGVQQTAAVYPENPVSYHVRK